MRHLTHPKTFVCIWAAKNWVTADVNAGVNSLHLLSYGLMLSWVNTILFKNTGHNELRIWKHEKSTELPKQGMVCKLFISNCDEWFKNSNL